MSLLTHVEHTLEHSQEITGGGGARSRRSHTRMCGRSNRGRRHILGDGQPDWSLRLDVDDECILHKVDDLAQDVVKDVEWLLLLLNIVEDEVPLVLRTSNGISNVRSHSSTEEAMETVEIWQEVLSRRRVGDDSRSVHEEHLLLAQSPISVDLSLHGVLCSKSSKVAKSSTVIVTPHVSKPHDYVNHMFMRL
jgi:hypothetical protein